MVADLEVRLGRHRALQGASFRAGRGEVVAVVGPNGAGKSTLVRAIAGLVRPDAGRVVWDGTDLLSLSSLERAKRVGLVPQKTHLDHPFSVEEVVSMGRYAHQGRFGWGRDPDAGLVADALRATDLVAFADRPVTALSGGEQQRVLVARLLAQAPDLYLLDEPTANLDLGQAAAVQRLMRRLADQGSAVVAVVHDLEAAARSADRVVLLAGGRVIAEGAPREVVTAARIEEAFGVAVGVTWSTDGDGVRIQVRE